MGLLPRLRRHPACRRSGNRTCDRDVPVTIATAPAINAPVSIATRDPPASHADDPSPRHQQAQRERPRQAAVAFLPLDSGWLAGWLAGCLLPELFTAAGVN